MKTTKPRLSLCVRFEEDRTYHACLKTIVTIEYWRDGGVRSDGRDTSDWCAIGNYTDTAIQGYQDLYFENYTFEDSDLANGFQASLAYNNYRAKLHDCERQVKTLRAYYKASEKLKDREGYSKTFGQEVNRMARIVGAEVVRIEKPEQARMQTGERYSEAALGDCVSWIDTRLATWLRERKEAKETVSA